MIIRIYYQNCWLDIETKNFKTVKEIEDHITGFSKTFTQRPEPNVKAQGMYIDWLEEDMKVGQKVRFNLMDVIEIREKKIKELKNNTKRLIIGKQANEVDFRDYVYDKINEIIKRLNKICKPI